jgi:hypothetical protein
MKTLTFDNAKSLQVMSILMNNFKAPLTLPGHLQAGNGAAMKT